MSYAYLIPLAAFVLVLAFIAWRYWAGQRQARTERIAYIQAYHFPSGVRSKLAFKHPQLSREQVDQVIRGLRQYFLICLFANAAKGRNTVAMPSKLVDDAWHEFLLNSREYAKFCTKAFGAYLHHTPDAAMPKGLEQPLINTWHQLKSRAGGGLGWAMLGGVPLLFAIDRAYGIEGGHHYGPTEIEALEQKRQAWLASNSGGGSDAGGDSGGRSSSDTANSDSGGSSCSSGGCGGGCGS